MTLLRVEQLQAGYGAAQVLYDVRFEIDEGEVVTLLGRNGMGKTTTIATLMGMLPTLAGSARFDGALLTGLPAYRIAQRGLGLVPEGRQVFPTLTVEENLVAPGPRGAPTTRPRQRQAYMMKLPWSEYPRGSIFRPAN